MSFFVQCKDISGLNHAFIATDRDIIIVHAAIAIMYAVTTQSHMQQ